VEAEPSPVQSQIGANSGLTPSLGRYGGREEVAQSTEHRKTQDLPAEDIPAA